MQAGSGGTKWPGSVVPVASAAYTDDNISQGRQREQSRSLECFFLMFMVQKLCRPTTRGMRLLIYGKARNSRESLEWMCLGDKKMDLRGLVLGS